MRHWLANIVTYSIAGLLIAGAGLFAWVRSAQVAITDERTAVARFEPAPAHEFDWHELGASSYLRNCANCHGLRGEGWDQYPPLNHVAELALTPDAREHLLDVQIYGLASGERVPMPPMGHMPDVELAAALNHALTAFSAEQLAAQVQLYAPDDVRARRGQRLSPHDVFQRRPSGAAEHR